MDIPIYRTYCTMVLNVIWRLILAQLCGMDNYRITDLFHNTTGGVDVS